MLAWKSLMANSNSVITVFVMAGSYVNSCCTSRGRNDFINELGLGALPELLNDQLQLLILLVDGT